VVRGRTLRKILAAATLAALAAAGCTLTRQEVVDADYATQLRTLDGVVRRLESAPVERRDEESIRSLRQVRLEMSRAHAAHAQDLAEIERLKGELEALRAAAGLGVHHVEILYFTRVNPAGIDLWVTPFDRSGDAVKAAGSFAITLNRPGFLGLGTLGSELCRWQFAEKEVLEHWQGELFKGYHLNLPWPKGGTPDVTGAVLRVEFLTAGGGRFMVTKELRIKE
jgi:outer membrane murein-binding lipoprotein Lpp